jgi:hypothetical protein
MGPPAPPLDDVPPVIRFLAPEPYARVTRRGGMITLALSVTDEGRGLAAVTVAGQAQAVGQGDPFALVWLELPVHPGILAVLVVARDLAGAESRRLLSVLVADAWHPIHDVPSARLELRIGPRALATGGLARLLARELEGFRLADLIPDPLARDVLGHELALEGLAHLPPVLALEPRQDGLHAEMRVPELSADLTMRGVVTARGPVRAEAVGISLDVILAYRGGELLVVPTLPVVGVQGLSVGLPYGLDRLLEPTLEARIQSEVHAALRARLPATARDFIQGVSVPRQIGLGSALPGGKETSVEVSLEPLRLALTPQGAEVELALKVSVPDAWGTAWPVPDITRCEAGIDAPGPGIDVSAPLAVLNLALEAWFRGTDGRFQIPAAPQDGLPAPVQVDLRLPPRVEGCGPSLTLELAGIHVETQLRVLGSPVGLDAELAVDLEVTPRVGPDGRLELRVRPIPGSIVSDSAAFAALVLAGAAESRTVTLSALPRFGELEPRLESLQVSGSRIALELSLP